MKKAHIVTIGLAAVLLAAIPIGLSAQDTRALGPGFYAIAVDEDAKSAWRINTANGAVSFCTVAADLEKSAPACSAWSSSILKAPQR